ncbi:MAG: hypothetical protein ACYSWZ_23355 [Planctomycetota bacterium]|jgi:hypothetical protein
MEKKIIVILLVFAFCVPSFGLSFMGAPKAGLKQGQFGLGLNYTTSEMDLEFDLIGGFPTETGEVESDMLFVDLGYGINDQWEGFVRLGVAKLEMDGWDGGNEFAYGFGTKVTISEQDAITWGALFQMVWIEGDDTVLGVDAEIDAYEIQIAIGPTYDAENVRIYGGPFLHLVDGDLEVIGIDVADIEQESVFGGYVGAQFDIAENSCINVEAQLTGDAWAISGGIGFGF